MAKQFIGTTREAAIEYVWDHCTKMRRWYINHGFDLAKYSRDEYELRGKKYKTNYEYPGEMIDQFMAEAVHWGYLDVESDYYNDLYYFTN
jgi:hypothetical protein